MNYKIHYPYITFTIQSPISIDDFFQSFHLSKKTIHLFKQNKEYTVNKRFVSSSTVLIKGYKLCIKAFQERNLLVDFIKQTNVTFVEKKKEELYNLLKPIFLSI